MSPALWGVVLSCMAAGVGLLLKTRAMTRGLHAALLTIGASFLVRLLLLVLGAVWLRRHGLAVTPFVVAFLLVFGVTQWVEIGYVVSAGRRSS